VLGALSRSGFIAKTGAGVAAAAIASLPNSGSANEPVKVLVLSGGTAQGAYEAGVLSRLPELRDDYAVICGTSIGALNGMLFAAAPPGKPSDALAEIWANVHTMQVMQVPPADRVDTSTGMFTRLWRPLRRLYRAFFGDVQGYFEAESVRNILRRYLLTPDRSAPIPLHTPLLWAVTDLGNGCGDYYYRAPRSGPFAAPFTAAPALKAALSAHGLRLQPAPEEPEALIEAVRASSALPGIFEPAIVGDRFFVDGGIINNTPFNLAKLAASTLFPNRQIEMHVVLLNPSTTGTAKDERRNVTGILLACYGVMSQRILDDAARLAVVEGELARALLNQRDSSFTERAFGSAEALQLAARVTLKYVRPVQPLLGTGWDFTDHASIEENYKQGAKDIVKGWRPYVLPTDFCTLGPR
jgi:predicted acylesterase/phospholipase RssA